MKPETKQKLLAIAQEADGIVDKILLEIVATKWSPFITVGALLLAFCLGLVAGLVRHG